MSLKSVTPGRLPATSFYAAIWDSRLGLWDGHVEESPEKHSASVRNPDGSVLIFANPTTGATGAWDKDSDTKETLTATWSPPNSPTSVITGYVLTLPNGDVEQYSATGQRTEIAYRSGRKEYFTYSDETTPPSIAPFANLLLSVTDQAGRSLQFEYDGLGRMVTMKDPEENLYQYTYNANGLLESVTYPTGGGRRYTYNEAGYSQVSTDAGMKYLLTGIHDEIEPGVWVRYSSFNYDSKGRPVATYNGSGLNKYTIDFATMNVTDPVGTVRQYGFTSVNGVSLQARVSQPGGAGCGPAAESTWYTGDGDVSARRDFNYVTTDFTYHQPGLEHRRRVGVGTSSMTTTTTTWNAFHRVRTAIAEPKRLTTFTYDDRGNLLTETVQATTDLNGDQGFAAVKTGSPRTTRYTYNLANQILTTTGPKGPADVTTYTYEDVTGNLLTLTNALGHVTTYSNYDAHGRVGRIVSANGVVTSLAYSDRGWLESETATAGGEQLTTTYTYDLVGKLRTLTEPGGNIVRYSYDDARRLTKITDSRGNSISYTLDAAGNRLAEEVKDPGGTLAYQLTRKFDALSRVQSVTGVSQ